MANMQNTNEDIALRLAEILEGDYCPDWLYERGVDEVAAELRRQHARITELEAQLEAIGAGGVSLYGGDSYGDGNVYRGTRSADSDVPTYTVHDLAHAKGVPSIVTSAMLAMGENLSEALDKLHVLESVTKRMALDLECVLLNPVGWDKQAIESLQAYRDLMDAWYPQDHVSPLGKD